MEPGREPQAASLETMRLGCYLETGRQQPADELGWRRAFQTGNGLCQGRQGKSRMAGAQSEGQGTRDPAGHRAQTLQGLWLRILIFILKALGGPCRIFSQGTAYLSAKCHCCHLGKGLERSQCTRGLLHRVVVAWASAVPVGSRDRVSGQGCVRMEPPGAGPGQGVRLGKE